MKIIETNLKFSSLSKRSKTTRIILHNADASKCSAQDIHRWHKERGWAGMGYHFLVRKDGTIERGRPENTVGAHASGYNSDSIGICFEGAFMTERMGQTQINAGKELITYLKSKYGISKVQKHKDVNPTNCPGVNFPFEAIVNGETDRWVQNSTGWWYRHADGSYTTNNWEKINGHWYKEGDAWYWLKEGGYMAKDEMLWIGNELYAFLSDGRMARTNDRGALV